MRFRLAFACAAILLGGSSTTFAATATGSFNSQLVIAAECKVQSTNTLDFGTEGVLDAVVDTTAALSVQCTNGQGYTISLDGGSGSSGTTTTRTMESGSEQVNYTMWQDAAHTTNWGNSGGEIMTALTGDGAAQSYTVYGRVPIQTTPTAGTYTDTVTITVTYP